MPDVWKRQGDLIVVEACRIHLRQLPDGLPHSLESTVSKNPFSAPGCIAAGIAAPR